MLFSSRKALSRSCAALIARDIAWDHLNSGGSFEDLVVRSDSVIEKRAQEEYGISLAKSDVAQIFRQALYFMTTRKVALLEHISAMDDYNRASKKGILLNFGEEIAEYMDDLPYLQGFKQ